jgi:cytosine/creatinine deaminase
MSPEDLDALGGRAVLARARVPVPFLVAGVPEGAEVDRDGAALVDLALEDGRVAAVAPGGSLPEPRLDLAGRHAWPMLVDVHAHLDKGHIADRTPNPTGDFVGALEATRADRTAYWRHDDVRRRMAFGLACAEAHGVAAIRTHLDSHEGQGETSWAVFREMREAWAGRVALQAVALVPLDVYATPYGAVLADLVAASGGAMGGVTRATGGSHDTSLDDADALLDLLFGLAAARNLEVDLHVDESSDSDALPRVAAAVRRHGYEGRVTCGHCCSLSNLPEDRLAETIAGVAAAGIRIVTLPTVNLYLQDRRAGRTPRWRGITAVQELRAAGVPVAVAGDNCRDPFYAYGDHDMLDTFRQGVKIAHLDHPFGKAAALVGPAPAAIMGLPGAGTIAPGAPADLILMQAWSMNQVVARPQSDRTLLKRGRRLDARPPAYDAP